jgi:hypothetical protein
MVPFSVKTQEEKCDPGIVATLFMESGWKVGIDRIWSGIIPKNENGRIAFEQRLSGHRNAFRVVMEMIPDFFCRHDRHENSSFRDLLREICTGKRSRKS